MPNPKIEALAAKLAELEPLSEAKDDAAFSVGVTQQAYNAAVDAVTTANADLESAQAALKVADDEYDAKWEEIKALADEAKLD